MFPAIRQALFAIRRATTSSGIEKKAKKKFIRHCGQNLIYQ
jgi:hypothetical protein